MPILVANWKMHGTPRDLEPWLAPLRSTDAVRSVACPPFPLLSLAAQELADSTDRADSADSTDSRVQLGAQDCHSKPAGAYTGAVSPSLLKEMGCAWVILGHSERRRDYGETPPQIAAKAQAARAVGLGAIVCLGESKETRDRLSTSGGEQAVCRHLSDELETLVGGLEAAPEGLEAATGGLMVAYEPIWAIGSGQAATPATAGAILSALRERANSMGLRAEFLYGGSVAPDNAADFLKAGADGLLVGGVSLQPDKLTATLEAMARA